MRSSFDRFDQSVAEHALGQASSDLVEGAMRVIEYMLGCSEINEIDFDSFTLQEAELALEHVDWHSDADSMHEAKDNRNNLLTQINRIAHIRQIVDGLRSPKKSFF